ncbi:MAG TPA: DNA-directed RNA polymerase subunit omega [Chroococcales cyanobacterium]|jgi:DNA-directed RNA polymerase omega subunit
MGHSSLLDKAENKYQLVLAIAKRAKILKDEIGKNLQPDAPKPIPLAIQEMLTQQEEA